MLPPDAYGHIARAVFDTPWFIREAEGTVIADIVRRRIVGERFDDAEIEARISAARAAQGPRSGNRSGGIVAVIPVYGVIMPRANLFTAMSGGTSVAQIRASIAEAIRDEDIVGIVAEFDSPGGSVEGIEELATWIRAQRGAKPMVAVVNTMCCSAAYYLAAQFDEIVASPSSLTGDIGVFMEHVEFSRADDEAGITTTIIRQPAAKHEVNDSEPLSDDARGYLAEIVGDYYGQFIAAVAKGRGVTTAAVRGGYGQGRSMTAGRAKAAALVDRIDTLEATIQRIAQGQTAPARARADAGILRVEVGAVAVEGPGDPDTIAALASGLPFSERLQLASAVAAEIAESARSRVALRAEEGRDLSDATRDGLAGLAGSLRATADDLDAAAAIAEPEPDPATTPRRRVDLEVLEAAYRGGYSLPAS